MKRLLKILLVRIPLILLTLGLLSALALKFVPVWRTPLMMKRAIEFSSDPDYCTRKQWVDIEKISPEMVKAVIAAEDNRFYTHNGFDTTEIRKMVREHREHGKKLRGCSTISQQTAKNVFTLCSGTFARKILEAFYTVVIEALWGKDRIMEVYLNVAEFGKGIFGVEAAAQHYFGTSAAKLNRTQASLLAAALPSPLSRNPARPGKYMQRRSRQIRNLIPKIIFRLSFQAIQSEDAQYHLQ